LEILWAGVEFSGIKNLFMPSTLPMSEITLYHNPRCSKSRQALQLLNERGITPTILLYLENPPDLPTLRRLLQQLNLPARALLRSGEAEYRALGLDDPACDEETIIAAMAATPKLIERPILVVDSRAVIGRPAEKVLELL